MFAGHGSNRRGESSQSLPQLRVAYSIYGKGGSSPIKRKISRKKKGRTISRKPAAVSPGQASSSVMENELSIQLEKLRQQKIRQRTVQLDPLDIPPMPQQPVIEDPKTIHNNAKRMITRNGPLLTFSWRPVIKCYTAYKCKSALEKWQEFVEMHAELMQDREEKEYYAIVIQRAWRGHSRDALMQLHNHASNIRLYNDSTITIQCLARCWGSRRKVRIRKVEIYRPHEPGIALIQRVWRGHEYGRRKARRRLRKILEFTLGALGVGGHMHRVLWLVRGGSGAEEGHNDSMDKEERELVETCVQEVMTGEKPTHRVVEEREGNVNIHDFFVVRSQVELRWMLLSIRRLGAKIERQRWHLLQQSKREREERATMWRAELSTRARARWVVIQERKEAEERHANEEWLRWHTEEEARCRMLVHKKRTGVGEEERLRHERGEREQMHIEEERQRRVARERVALEMEEERRRREAQWLSEHMATQSKRREEETERARRVKEQKSKLEKAQRRRREETDAVAVEKEREQERRRKEEERARKEEERRHVLEEEKRRQEQEALQKTIREASRIVRAALRALPRIVEEANEHVEEAMEVAQVLQEQARKQEQEQEAARAREERIVRIVEKELRPKLKGKEKAMQRRCKAVGLAFDEFGGDVEAAYRAIAQKMVDVGA